MTQPTEAPVAVTTAGADPRGIVRATLGFLMVATGSLMLLVGSLLWGLDGAFFALPTVLALLGAYLIRRARTALRVGGLVLSVLAGGTVFWTVFGLAEPDSFLDFVPGALVLPGALLALVAGVISMRSTRSGRAVGRGERRAARVVVAALGVAAVASLVLTITGRDAVDDDVAARADLAVELQDFEFDASTYDVQAGDTVLVKNSDPFVHTFTVEALGIDRDLGPGDEIVVTIPDQPGTYVLYCRPHTSDPDDPGTDDMTAVLDVG
jgi:plastocyanin